MKEKKRLVIVEDHTIVRDGLCALLETEDDFEVVAEAADGMEAIRRINNTNPDLVILDLNMPKMDGISVIREIKGHSPHIKILALTMFKDEAYILDAFKSGVDGYCLKTSSSDEVLAAIRVVLSGKMFVSPDISDLVMEGYIEGRRTIKKQSSLDTLTQREKEILKLVGERYQNKAIADYLCISVKTVEKHRANIMEKLDLHTAADLTAYAIEKGLVTK